MGPSTLKRPHHEATPCSNLRIILGKLYERARRTFLLYGPGNFGMSSVLDQLKYPMRNSILQVFLHAIVDCTLTKAAKKINSSTD